MPTKPPSIGMSTCLSDGDTIRAELTRATSRSIGDIEVADQPRRDGAAARLDAAGAVEQQHRAPKPGEIMRGRRAGRSTADHHDIEDFGNGHDDRSLLR